MPWDEVDASHVHQDNPDRASQQDSNEAITELQLMFASNESLTCQSRNPASGPRPVNSWMELESVHDTVEKMVFPMQIDDMYDCGIVNEYLS